MELSALIEVAERRRRLPRPETRRAIREGAGVTQRELAETIGVARVSIGRYESGSRRPRGAQFDRYLEALERLSEIR